MQMDAPVDLDKVIHWIKLSNEAHPQDMTWFAANFIYYLSAMLVAAKVIEEVLFPKFLPDYKEHSLRSIRNLVTYVLEVLVTSYCFYLNITSGIRVHLMKHNTYDLEMCRQGLLILCCLYLFELIYRLEMNLQLTVHHVITLGACILGVQGGYDTKDSKYYAASILLALTATTEQLSFIALFMYRIKHKYTGFALRFAAAQTFACKTMFLVILCRDVKDVVWGVHVLNPNGTHWYYIWRVLILTLVPALFVTQVYGAWVMWKLGSSKHLLHPRRNSTEGKAKEDKKIEEIAQAPETKRLKHA